MKRLLLLLYCGVLLAEDVYQRPQRAERSHDFDVQHYRIQLRFDEATRSFFGETTVTLDALRDGFDKCELDADTFRVTEVRGAQRFTHQAGKLVVFLDKPVRYRERVSFTVVYEAHNVRIDPVKYGMTPDYPLGLSFWPDRSLILTMSFPEGAHHWFPCYDHPNDKATAEVIATVRESYQAISNGRLAGMTRRNGERTFHWIQDKPHATYLFVLAAGPYVAVSDSEGELPVRYWVNSNDAADAPRSFGPAREMIRFFEAKLGVPYPWAKYDQIAIPGIGGGAESTSATVEGESLIHDEKAEKDYPSRAVVSHEIAHQWWGDLITMRDWPHTWLNESFASYYEHLYTKSRLGEDEGAWDLMQKRQRYLAEASSKYTRPIVFDRWEWPNQNFDRHTYEKGAAVLHMLAWSMGEENFDRAIKYFLQKHAYQSVDTHDLQVAIRESTGQVLDWFFDQWVYKAGHPQFSVEQHWANGKLTLKVAQEQKVSEWVPVFQTPVDIGITMASGKRIERVWIRKAQETFVFDCPQEPLSVNFDEGHHLLMTLSYRKPHKQLLYEVEHEDGIGRAIAASELGDKPDVLKRVAVSDKFWLVRRFAIRAMAADAAFFKSRDTDPNSIVRSEALYRLASLKDPGLVPYLKERFAKEDSYLAQSAALQAIGQCGGKAAAGFLREAQSLKSPRNVIANTARSALEKLQ